MKYIDTFKTHVIYSILVAFDTIKYKERYKKFKQLFKRKNAEFIIFCSIMLSNIDIPTVVLKRNTLPCTKNFISVVGWLFYYAMNKDTEKFKKLFTEQCYTLQRLLHYIFFPQRHNSILEDDLLQMLPTLYSEQELLQILPTPTVLKLQNAHIGVNREFLFPAYLLSITSTKHTKFYYMIKEGNTIYSNNKAKVHNLNLLDKYGLEDYGVIFAATKGAKSFSEVCQGTPEQIRRLLTNKYVALEDLRVTTDVLIHNKKELIATLVKHNKKFTSYYLHSAGISAIRIKYKREIIKVVDTVLNNDFEIVGVIIYIGDKKFTLHVRKPLDAPPAKVLVLTGYLEDTPLFPMFVAAIT